MKKFLSILGGIILTFALSSTAHAQTVNLIQNGSFEYGSDIPDKWSTGINTYDPTAYIENWYANGGLVYVNNYWIAENGTRSVDLNGWGPGSISQTFNTVPGAFYVVSFWMSGNPDTSPDYSNIPTLKTMSVTVNDIQESSYSFDTSVAQNTHEDMKWDQKYYIFQAINSTSTIKLASTTNYQLWGPVVDDVVITSEPTTIKMCKDGSWQNWGGIFKSQGDCISYIATGGKNLPSGQ